MNNNLDVKLNKIAEVAGYLWNKNWAERNGGNMSINVTNDIKDFKSFNEYTVPSHKLSGVIPALADNVFYVTGTGQRMRDVAKSPLDFGALILLSETAEEYKIISERQVQPTSELASHLAIHGALKKRGMKNGSVVHTHPNELIALSHIRRFLDSDVLTKTLWSMIPEARIVVPKGVGVVPYVLTGTVELAVATMKALEKHDVVLWEKHGILAVNDDIIECFDAIDTMTKCAQIYLTAKLVGEEPEGLNEDQMSEIAEKFSLPR